MGREKADGSRLSGRRKKKLRCSRLPRNIPFADVATTLPSTVHRWDRKDVVSTMSRKFKSSYKQYLSEITTATTTTIFLNTIRETVFTFSFNLVLVP